MLDRNWRCRLGEIDIVARDGDALVVCEVKTRRSDRYGSPIEAMTRAKAERLHTLGMAWARAHDVTSAALRVDVVTVLLERGARPVVTHYSGLS